MRRLLGIVLLWAYAAQPLAAWEEPYAVLEGRGIRGVAFLGDSIEQVKSVWGAADSVKKEDSPYNPLWLYAYYARGALFTAAPSGIIIGITVYCNTYNPGSEAHAGSIWVNHGPRYQTIHGVTAKGLSFKDLMRTDELYAVYGKPELSIEEHSPGLIRQLIGRQASFIVNDHALGLAVYYPARNMVCAAVDGLVESCHFGGLIAVAAEEAG